MDVDDAISFKVAINMYNKSEKKNVTEMRYVSVPKCREHNFEYLRRLLEKTFSRLAGKNFTITWIDEEKDAITISTDVELAFALSQMGSVKKIIVTLDEYQPFDEFDHSASRKRGSKHHAALPHPNVVCDVCDRDIYGYRYKCLSCYDFDLCQRCEYKNNHSNHCMLRIPVPTFEMPIDIRGSPLGDWLEARPIQNDSEAYHFKKHCKKNKGEQLRGGRKASCHPHHFRTIDGSKMLNTISAVMNGFTNLAGTANSNAGESSQENAAASPSATAHNKEASSRNVADSLCTLLGTVIEEVFKPHGVEVVDVHIDDNNFACNSTARNENNTDSEKSSASQQNVPMENGEVSSDAAAGPSNNNNNDTLIEIKASLVPEKTMTPESEQLVSIEMPSQVSTTTANEDPLSDTDSDSSDCVVLKSPENGYDWTILNSDGGESNQRCADLMRNDENKAQEVERMIESFEKSMEVGERPPKTPPPTVNEETRFVLVSDEFPPLTSGTSSPLPRPTGWAPVPPPPAEPPFVAPPPFFAPPIVPAPFVMPSPINLQNPFSSFGSPAVAPNLRPWPATPPQMNHPHFAPPQMAQSQTPLTTSQSPQQQQQQQQPQTRPQSDFAPKPDRSIDLHVAPHVAKVVAQLVSMGYSNNDGWLTELAIIQEGNINAVLDFLTSVNERRP